jgi:hypothetical protein
MGLSFRDPLAAARSLAAPPPEVESELPDYELFGNSWMTGLLGSEPGQDLPDLDAGTSRPELADAGASIAGVEPAGQENVPASPESVPDVGSGDACAGTDFVSNAKCMFSSLDTDGDGFVFGQDLDDAMARNDLTTEQAAAVAMLRRYREGLEELSDDEWFDEDDGITLSDLDDYQHALEEFRSSGKVPEGYEGVLGAETMYQDGVNRINGVAYHPTEGGPAPDPFPEGGPSLDAIQQGSVGSCSFLSAVGSLVGQGRGAEIQQMIAPNADGSYTVSFPGRDPVVVAAPTKADIAYGATAGSNGIWLTVLEKAYGQLRDDDDNPNVNVDAAEGSLSDAVGTLTGNDTDVDDNWCTNSSTTAEKLEAAMADHRVVNASQMGSDVQGIPGKHAYTVVGYDPATQTVTLRNPWGPNSSGERTGADGRPADGTDDGVFTLTVEEFDDLFTDICYEQPKR